MKIKFNYDDELPLNKMIEICSMAIVSRLLFMKITNIIHKFFQTNVCVKYKIESKNELKETDIKNCMCYYFDDIIKDVDIYFSDFYQTKNYMKIFQFITFHTKL